jgi:multicomponent K+:H+ antiporter subunit E
MKRLLPAPLLSIALFALWIMLNASLDAGNLLLAAIVALAAPVICAPLRPLPVRIRRPGVLLRLIAAVAHDVVVSNLLVGWGVLNASRRMPHSSFVVIPLELRDPNALAALAVITTVIPGTVWSELALDRSAVRLHVFDLADEAAFIAHYKSRYEQPLKETFE